MMQKRYCCYRVELGEAQAINDVPSFRCRVGELEVMYSQADLAMELESTLVRGFDVARISKVAFEIYQDHGLELTESMNHALLILMAMEEGKEFELTESKFLALISEIRSM